MKKLVPIAACLILGVSSLAYSQQTPEAFKYQASLRNAQGEIIADKLVSIRVTILAADKAEYSEVHTIATNQLGLVNFEIGRGTQSEGKFSAINWDASKHFVRIEMDEQGGRNYKELGTSELLSVPYSIHAKMASDVMPGSITIQNEIAARQAGDDKLQTQINIVRGMLEQGAKGSGNDNMLGVPQDLEALKVRYMNDSVAVRSLITSTQGNTNNLTSRFTADSAAKNTRINNNLTRFSNDSVAVRSLISTETARATGVESGLRTDVNTATSTNNSQATSIANNTTAIATNANTIAAEVTRATGVEAGLRTDVNTTTATNNAQATDIAANTTAIAGNTTAIEANATAIGAEVIRATDAEAGLRTDVDAATATNNAQATDIAENTTAIAGNTTAITAETDRALAAEAALDAKIESRSGSGILRMTTAQRDVITAEGGEMIYNTTTNKFQGYQLINGVQTEDTKHLKQWTSVHFTNYMSTDYYIWTRQSQFSVAQSFTASSTNALTALSVYSNHNSGNGDYTLNIYEGEGIYGTLLSTQPITFENQNNGYNIEDKFPVSGVNVIAGEVYTFEIKSSVNPNFDNQNTTYTTGSQLNVEYTSDEHTQTGYADGAMYVNGQPFVAHWTQVGDMRFKTYITPPSVMGWETLR